MVRSRRQRVQAGLSFLATKQACQRPHRAPLGMSLKLATVFTVPQARRKVDNSAAVNTTPHVIVSQELCIEGSGQVTRLRYLVARNGSICALHRVARYAIKRL